MKRLALFAATFLAFAVHAANGTLKAHDVEEAVYMADRIMVLGPRPTTIQAIFEVPFPHPRKLSSPEVQALRETILRELGVEA